MFYSKLVFKTENLARSGRCWISARGEAHKYVVGPKLNAQRATAARLQGLSRPIPLSFFVVAKFKSGFNDFLEFFCNFVSCLWMNFWRRAADAVAVLFQFLASIVTKNVARRIPAVYQGPPCTRFAKLLVLLSKIVDPTAVCELKFFFYKSVPDLAGCSFFIE